MDRPPIVCLCGSTRFMEAFFAAGWALTLQDQIVLSVGVCQHAEDHGAEALGEAVAKQLDELHKRKIDLADWVLVLNVGGYEGDSTRAEIRYAQSHGKPVMLLFPADDAGKEPPAKEDYPSWEIVANAASRAEGRRPGRYRSH